jgi:exodeoxyribonuclease V alpha subunit
MTNYKSLIERLFGKNFDPKETKENKKVDENVSIMSDILIPLVNLNKKSTAKRIASKIRNPYDVIDNPYSLYLKGYINFCLADEISVGLEPIDSPNRIEAGIHHTLETLYDEGKSCIAIDQLICKIKDLIGVDITDDVIRNTKSSIAIIEENLVYLPKIYFLRRKTLEILKNNPPTYHYHNDEHVNDLVGNKYVILTGPAGSGKSTILRKLYKESEFKEHLKIAVTALTGKAASLLGPNAQTLHSLLGFRKGGFTVKKLDYGIVIVDEASMMDWYVANSLFTAAKGQVILSGDPNQLPPVKGGSVFAELLKILPVVELKKVYRFAGGENKVSIIKKKGIFDILNTTLTLAAFMAKKNDDFQVITPIKYSPVGTENLNIKLQSKLNPHGAVINGGKFRVGDRVIVTKNCYNKEVPAYNGQIGHITETEFNNIYVKLQSGITLPFIEDEIELAYALTVHKSQGSQYAKVIFVSPNSVCGDFIDEKMEYTGTTRGEVETFVIRQ